MNATPRWLASSTRILRRTVLGVLVAWCLFAYSYAFATGSPSDYAGYLEGAQRFLDTGSPYVIPVEPLTYEQIFEVLPFVHPPIALYVFVPFLWLPAVLWWLIPAAIFAWCAYRSRPGEWAWGRLAAHTRLAALRAADPGREHRLYVAALTGLGSLYGWPAALIVLKPHSLVWTAFSVRHRSFWVGLGIVALLAVPFGYLWMEWVTMLTKITSVSAFYLPKLLPLVPAIWWLARSKRLPEVRLEGPGAELAPSRSQ